MGKVRDFLESIGFVDPQIEQAPIPDYARLTIDKKGNTIYPGQKEWVSAMMAKGHGKDEGYYHNKYIEAVTSPGFSGNYYVPPEGMEIENAVGGIVKGLQSNIGVQAEEPTPTPQPPRPSPTLAPDATDFEKMALPIVNEAGIHPAVAFGMANAEGGKIGSNNVYNINAVDSNPQAAHDYATPEDGVRAFTTLISEDPRYSKAFAARKDATKMLREIEAAGYAGDPKTWKSRSKATGGAGKTYNKWSDFVGDVSGFRRYEDQP